MSMAMVVCSRRPVLWPEQVKFVEPSLLSESEAVSRDQGCDNKVTPRSCFVPGCPLVIDSDNEVIILLRIYGLLLLLLLLKRSQTLCSAKGL